MQSKDNPSDLRHALDELDLVHRAFVDGWNQGRAVGAREASTDLARQIVLDLARDDAYVATGMAQARGNGWATAIAEAAS